MSLFPSIFFCIIFAFSLYVFVGAVSHIQRIGCQPGKNYFDTVANPARGLLNMEKKKKSGMESTSYVLSFRIVFFGPCDHGRTGWIFDVSLLCENSIVVV